MLLQVDIYPHTVNAASSESAELPPPVKTLYVSLNTCTSATILTVGRKDSDVVLQGDKSVSRQHMSLELVSSDDGFHGEDGKPSPRAPDGPEETKACKKESTVVVLKDSSRFGTFVISENEKEETKSASKDDDSATGDEATDDEGQGAVSQQASSQFSSIATKLVNPTSARSDKVDGPTVLTSLCQSNGRAIIQCGQNGSTLVVRRVPIRVVLSRAPKATKELWAKRCPTLGVSLLETIDEATTTHLVTADRITNAKSLVAWFLKKPMVTFDYLEALWNRTSPEDELPNATDFSPPPGDKEDFWDQEPKRGLWSHATLLSYAGSDDMEALCRAAGATIVELYNEKDPIEAADEAIAKHNGCFFINSSTRTYAKIVKHLKRSDVPALTQKSLALFISQQEALKDSQDNLIGKPAGANSDQETSKEKDDDSTVAEEEEAPSKDLESEASNQPKSQPSQRSARTAKRKAAAPDDNIQLEESPSKDVDTQAESMDAEPLERPISSRTSRKRVLEKEDDNDALERPATSRSSRKKSRKEADVDEVEAVERPRASRKRNLEVVQEVEKLPTKKKRESFGGWTDVRKPSQQDSKKSSQESASNEDGEIQAGDDDEEEQPDEDDGDEEAVVEQEHYGVRKSLPKTKDGWLVAAPEDRREFKATEAELLDTLEDGATSLPPTAATDIVKGMVVAAKSQKRGGAVSQSGVQDFKRFRKNPVIRVGEVSRIQMRTVLPKQSDRQTELQDEQAELEVSLREAEALFRDQGNKGGNIRSHFKPRGKRTRKV